MTTTKKTDIKRLYTLLAKLVPPPKQPPAKPCTRTRASLLKQLSVMRSNNARLHKHCGELRAEKTQLWSELDDLRERRFYMTPKGLRQKTDEELREAAHAVAEARRAQRQAERGREAGLREIRRLQLKLRALGVHEEIQLESGEGA